MKKLLNFRLITAIILMIFITSCTKDWTCTCKTTASGDWGEDYSNVKKSLAKQRCSDFESQLKKYTGDANASCSIK